MVTSEMSLGNDSNAHRGILKICGDGSFDSLYISLHNTRMDSKRNLLMISSGVSRQKAGFQDKNVCKTNLKNLF